MGSEMCIRDRSYLLMTLALMTYESLMMTGITGYNHFCRLEAWVLTLRVEHRPPRVNTRVNTRIRGLSVHRSEHKRVLYTGRLQSGTAVTV